MPPRPVAICLFSVEDRNTKFFAHAHSVVLLSDHLVVLQLQKRHKGARRTSRAHLNGRREKKMCRKVNPEKTEQILEDNDCKDI